MLASLLWLVLIIVFTFVEIATSSMVSVWFAVGSVIALIFSVLGLSFYAQFIIFVFVSLITLIFLGPFLKKIMPVAQKTNFDMIISKETNVTQDIDNIMGTGSVKIMGQEWSAKSLDGSNISAGSNVVIRAIEGVKVVVERV